MSYTLTPYAVELAKIQGAIGSRDKRLLERLAAEFEDDLDAIDGLGDGCDEPEDDGKSHHGVKSLEDAMPLVEEFLRSMLDEDDEQEEPRKPEDAQEEPGTSAEEALRHLIMGEPLDRRAGFKYAYLLECLCRHFGEALPHDLWCDLRSGSGWFDELDGTLQAAGVSPETLSIRRHLVQRGPPIAIPRHGDFPYVGFLAAGEIGPALQAIQAARIDDIGEENGDEEPWLPEGLNELRDWLQACADSRRDLVCFYA